MPVWVRWLATLWISGLVIIVHNILLYYKQSAYGVIISITT